jgi:glycosyltransferase involved in cell wall biosynthesis
LELTLSSVAAQSYPHIEHIVIDGGSSDGTVEMLERFRSAVPLRWLSEPDSGMYAAINKGISLARGTVLSYLNSDDLYLPWSIERAVSALDSSGADLAFGDLFVLVRRGGRARRANLQFYPRFHPRVYAHELTLGQPTVFWRRRVTDLLGGFDDRMRYCGDFEYWLRTAIAGFRYTHVREVLAVAVEHEAALSMLHGDEIRSEIEQTRARYADSLKPRKLARLRGLMQIAHWRGQVILLRANLRRQRPSDWPHLIRFLRTADLDLDGSSVLPLLLPVPLPKSWVLWRLEPGDFDIRLRAEILGRRSMM